MPNKTASLDISIHSRSIVDVALHLEILVVILVQKFLNVFEFPADANRGFDLPAAILAPLYDDWEVQSEDSSSPYSSLASPLYSQTAVIRMPMPDFSMPYNVVALTCTVLSLFVASTLGSLLYRFDKVSGTSDFRL